MRIWKSDKDVVIKDANGDETNYTVTTDGQIKYNGETVIDLEQYLIIKAGADIPYNYYYLPTGVMMLTDQNGKIVSAVTHVLINDPTTGDGILIENMLAQMC